MRNKIFNLNIEYITDKQEALELVKKNGFELWRVSEKNKDDWDVAYAAVMQDGRAFRFVSERLKHNKEFVLAVIENLAWFKDWVPNEILDEIENVKNGNSSKNEDESA